MSELGFYSVVRYIADLERQEPLNVGLLLSSEGNVYARFFDREDVEEPAVVRRFGDLVEHLIAEERTSSGTDFIDGETFLQALANRRFAHFDLTDPRTVDIQGDLEAAAAELSRRLVETSVSSRPVLFRG